MTDATEPFDRRDLRKCSLCGKGMMHCESPVFYEITARTVVLDVNAIRQQVGLEMMMGGHAAIAAALAPTTAVGHRMPATRHLICAQCALDSSTPIARFIEPGEDAENG